MKVEKKMKKRGEETKGKELYTLCEEVMGYPSVEQSYSAHVNQPTRRLTPFDQYLRSGGHLTDMQWGETFLAGTERDLKHPQRRGGEKRIGTG